jgi:general stress protein 26
MGNYTIRYANSKSVQQFKQHLEHARLEGSPRPDTRRTSPIAQTPPKNPLTKILNAQAIGFLKTHSIGVLSTIDRSNQLHGSVVYYIYKPEHNKLYILTKSQTEKAHNILATHQIAFTIFDEPALQTLQLQGTAEIESDSEIKQEVFTSINRLRDYGGEKHHPPVTKLIDGHFIVFSIAPLKGTFSDFKFRR